MTPTLEAPVSRYWKTFGAFLVWLTGLLNAITTAPEFGEAQFIEDITSLEALILLAGLAGVGFTYAKKNLPPVGQPADPNISEAAR